MSIGIKQTNRPEPDQLLIDIADYVVDYKIDSEEALETARYCLMDTLGCGLLALNYPACLRMMGPIVPGAVMTQGARVPGLDYELDPVMAAFNIGCMNRWLDFNDTWLAAEWGHPSDNLAGILATADYLSRLNENEDKAALTVNDVLIAMIKAHEIQGVIALENSFNRVGLDHVLLVRVATTAVVTGMLGGSKEQIINAVSNAWLDGGALRTYRHAPNTGSRKSWAAGDASSRGVRHAFIAMNDEMGYPSALSADNWGFNDVLFQGKSLQFTQGFAAYVMENVLFKVSFPAEFHAQTAVEAALKLHNELKERLDEVEKVIIQTQEAGVRIIDKTGPLDNPADRDHCLQYMVAIPLIFGRLTADDYENDIAQDPRVDALREKMEVVENKQYSIDYLAADLRSIPNAVQVYFKDGSCTENIEVAYPIGHRRRRSEAIPLLQEKFADNIRTRLGEDQVNTIIELCNNVDALSETKVSEFMQHWIVKS